MVIMRLADNKHIDARIPAQNVVDHYESPKNVGSLDKNMKNVGTGSRLKHPLP